jgi:hypothetical protein
MSEETDLVLNLNAESVSPSNISYKSFKTQNLPCKIPTVVTETMID